jgi:anti-sigma factor RsiW
MTAHPDDNDDLQLQAYLDGELEPSAVSVFERRLAEDDVLRARYATLLSLRQSLRALPPLTMPKGLQDRVTSRIEGGQTPARARSWRALVAAAIVGAVLGGAVMVSVGHYRTREDLVSQVVASHVRGLLASQPFDVASSDRHTVKPWFSERIPESPPVVDLAEQGFVLSGGRIDVINGAPVATLVYRHATHVVSLMMLPAGQPAPSGERSGYRVRSWTDGRFTYVAICDLSGQDLAAFERAFTTAAAG